MNLRIVLEKNLKIFIKKILRNAICKEFTLVQDYKKILAQALTGEIK